MKALAAPIVAPPPLPQRGFWRTAFAAAGLGPAVLAILVALVATRALSWALFIVDGSLREFVAVFVRNFVAIGISALVIVLATVAASQLAPAQGPRRRLVIAAAVVLAPPFGTLLRLLFREVPVVGFGPRWSQALDVLRDTWPRYALLAALLAAFVELHRRQAAADAAVRQALADRDALDRESAAARLQLLEAQVEPHFLFNTLATVRRLGETDRGAAAAMVASLMQYLEAALPLLRGGGATLASEARLVGAYLAVQKVRFGPRLSFDIDIPPSLRELPLPPTMLLTLVENAIKHGLQPAARGGSIRVAARREGGRLVVTVADSGVGFGAGSGKGTGLANIRARLAAQFGEAASLELAHNDFGGVTAMLVLPLPAGAPE